MFRHLPDSDKTVLRRQLASLGMTYAQYLRTPSFDAFRKKWRYSGLASDGCYVCRWPRVQMHHLTYERLGRESLEDVIALCDHHHKEVHVYLSLERSLSLDRAHEAYRNLYVSELRVRTFGVACWWGMQAIDLSDMPL